MRTSEVDFFQPTMSLRRRLVLFAMMCALPALVVVALQFFLQNRSIQQRAELDAEAITLRLEGRIERLLNSVESVVQAIGILDVELAAGPDRCAQALQRSMRSFANVLNLSLSAVSGEVLCSAMQVPPNTNVADRRYFQEALAQRRSVLSGYTLGRITRREAVQLAVPILNAKGEVRALAIAAINPVDLTQRLVESSGTPLDVSLFDKDGVLLSHTASTSFFQRGKSYASSALFARLRENRDYSGEIRGIDGQDKLFSLRPVVFNQEVVFYISAGADLAALSRQSRRETFYFLLLVLLTGAMVFVIAMVSFRPVVLARTRALINVAQRVALGRYGERVPITVRDEWMPIETAVNAMLDSVEADKAQVLALSERNRLIAEATNDVIYDWNLGTGEFWCNRLSLINSEAIGQTGSLTSLDDWFLAIHPEDQHTVRTHWQAAVASGESHWECRYRVPREAGQVAYILERARLLRNDADALVRVVSGARDVTAQTITEMALQESESRYRLLFENSLDGVLQTCVDGAVISANAAACHMLGYTENQLQALGRGGIADLKDPRLHALLKLRTETGSAGGTLTMIRGDGRRIEVELTSNVYRDREGHLFTSMVIRDMTERLKAEAEIKLLNHELEARVLQRTEQLELANRELEAFSYSVSHDLRGPLNTIDGFSKMLGDKVSKIGNDQAAHYLRRIRAGVRQMGELIEGLLSLAQVSRTALHWKEVDLGKMAQTTLIFLQDLEPQRRVAVQVEEGLLTHGDPRLLDAVVSNLIGNAWKFTSQQENARIHMGQLAGTGETVVFFVQDNGAGFDMAHADKLFGTFQRLHAASEFPGSGIGLATVQRILRRHGGRIWAESSPGQGATFYFTLGAAPA